MLKMDYVQTAVAGAAHTQDTYYLRNRAFNTRAFLVSLLEDIRLLTLTSTLQSTKRRFGDETDLSLIDVLSNRPTRYRTFCSTAHPHHMVRSGYVRETLPLPRQRSWSFSSLWN